MNYDIVVVGAGPAGLSAALNGAIRNKSVLVLGPQVSESLKGAAEINNYLGIQDVSGVELLQIFRDHLASYSVDFQEDNVQNIYDMGKSIGVLLEDNTIINADAVVYASGIRFEKSIPGAQDFVGRGVGTCATCDAALYEGKPVVVVGYNDHAVEEANFISELASSTTFVNRTRRDVDLAEGIRELRGNPEEIRGGDVAESILVDGEEIFADGFFIIKDARKPDSVIPGVDLDGNHIKVDENMETNLKGIFAAGDCTGRPYQIAKAVGQGQVAGLAAASFSSKKQKNQ